VLFISYNQLYLAVFSWLLVFPILAQAENDAPPALGLITIEEIQLSAAYPGPQTEKKLKDLAKADYHYGKALYYKNQQKTGFIALERFELALERAIGDLREAAYILDESMRKAKVTQIFYNWQNAFFKRANNSVVKPIS
jgi:hypothetical protein